MRADGVNAVRVVEVEIVLYGFFHNSSLTCFSVFVNRWDKIPKVGIIFQKKQIYTRILGVNKGLFLETQENIVEKC